MLFGDETDTKPAEQIVVPQDKPSTTNSTQSKLPTKAEPTTKISDAASTTEVVSPHTICTHEENRALEEEVLAAVENKVDDDDDDDIESEVDTDEEKGCKRSPKVDPDLAGSEEEEHHNEPVATKIQASKSVSHTTEKPKRPSAKQPKKWAFMNLHYNVIQASSQFEIPRYRGCRLESWRSVCLSF